MTLTRRLVLGLITVLCLIPCCVHAAGAVRVLVIPFEIRSLEDLSYLQTEIPEVIRRQLSQEGAVMVSPAVSAGLTLKGVVGRVENVRELGRGSDADYVIWGSLTWIGQQFSLDAKMVDALGAAPPSIYSKEGKGIENLSGVVSELTREMGLTLFRREQVVTVEVTGNERIEDEAVKRAIKTQAGDTYLPRRLSEDLKAVYAMGYFDDVRIETETTPDGKTVIFQVKEKPTIRSIGFKGNEVFDNEEIREALNIRTGSILNLTKVQRNAERIEELYTGKNYHNVAVTYDVKPLKNNQADLEYDIREGKKLYVEKIEFVGNTAYPEKKLRKLISTKEKTWLYWFTSSGDLKPENLSQDAARLAAYYQNSGYIQVKVSEPEVIYEKDLIEVKFKIDEGPRFRVGEVDLTGDLIFPSERLREEVAIAQEEFYNRETLRNDVLSLMDLYSDQGYAFADVAPQIERDLENQVVDITFTISKGKQVYYEEILISGNSKTRDKVIRRQLAVYEQELYSGVRLKQGIRNLHRLEYFEEVKVDTQKGSGDDKMVLKLDIKEKPTGAFSFGGGYSNVESLFATASISQNNFLGRGQIVEARVMIGGRSSQFRLSFTEPWLFDIPLSAGADAYLWDYDYDTYTKDSIGGGFRFGYPIWRYTRLTAGYSYDVADLKDLEEDAPRSIKDLEGRNTTSAVATGVRYDSRNRSFNATKGSRHDIAFKYAGLGGSIGFSKVVGEVSWYVPLFWKLTGYFRSRGGYVTENSGKTLPDYEKFYLGGINSLRGFAWQDISLVDEDGYKEGGDKFVQFNFELIFPLFEAQGLSGVVFFDTGQVYRQSDTIDLGDLRQSAGGGIRWTSPMGPIRIEYGYVLDPIPGFGEGGKWEFAMGGNF